MRLGGEKLSGSSSSLHGKFRLQTGPRHGTDHQQQSHQVAVLRGSGTAHEVQHQRNYSEHQQNVN